MDARNYHVCTQIPSTVEEGVTYHSLPLTYGSKWTFMLNGQDPAIPGTYYICVPNAYYRLPREWRRKITVLTGVSAATILLPDQMDDEDITREANQPHVNCVVVETVDLKF
ncbi:hypothetical protein NDU88_007367 [Pleurodeles waltl]|uniref:Uncharacterized protein n=1 Tax=Pleurodeles waltl TaxID=8319 RepID=A0AAV7QLU7_PLEWA|nr:hypothetical protein NDU88_007367 [Pleurodeles waltl]